MRSVCGMTSQQIFSVWTKLKVNKSFQLYTYTSKTSKGQCFPLLLWTEVQPVHTPVRTQAYGLALSQSNFSILPVFCLVYNNSCYYFNFKTCAVQSDAEIPQPGNQLSFMLHELVFLECLSQIASYPYKFAPYSYSCKILQPYVAATVRMRSDAVLSSNGALLMKTVIKNNCQ